jgi:YD repeat-containing protein
MSCYISAGVTVDTCEVGIGGIKKIYIVGGGQLTGFTYDVEDQVTGVTATAGTTLYGFNLKRGVSSLTQTISKNYENGSLFFEQVLNIVLYKMDKTKRNQILMLAVNDYLQVVAVDNNDVQYLLGEVRGMTLGGTITTGTALADRNGFELAFTAQEPQPASIIYGPLATVFASPIVVVP